MFEDRGFKVILKDTFFENILILLLKESSQHHTSLFVI